MKILESTRFDDVFDPDEPTYRGYNHLIQGDIEGEIFRVRSYDDEPGRLTIVSPFNALQHKDALALVSFLCAAFGATEILAYHGATGRFRAVHPQTLKFMGT